MGGSTRNIFCLDSIKNLIMTLRRKQLLSARPLPSCAEIFPVITLSQSVIKNKTCRYSITSAPCGCLVLFSKDNNVCVSWIPAINSTFNQIGPTSHRRVLRFIICLSRPIAFNFLKDFSHQIRKKNF